MKTENIGQSLFVVGGFLASPFDGEVTFTTGIGLAMVALGIILGAKK